jgi:hypothetical protein
VTKRQLKTRSKEIRDQLDGPIGTVIANLQALQAENPDYDIDIGIGSRWGEDYVDITVNWKEEETNEELALRETQERNRVEYRRREYERLKKEFEK